MMKHRHIRAMLVLMLALVLAGGYIYTPTGDVYAASKTVKVKSIKLNHKNITVKKGKKITLKATVNPAKAKKNVVWATSNKKIATVSKTGKVTAKKKGKVKITAKVKGTKKKAVCTVYVGTPVKKIKLVKTSATLAPGKKTTIKVKYTPAKPSLKGVTYTSSNKKIAKVTSKGVVKAVKAGKATITVKPKDESAKAVKFKVTVKKAAATTPETTPGTTPETTAPGSDGDTQAGPGTGTDTSSEEPKAETEVVATTSEDINKALTENKDLRTLIIRSENELNLTIDEGTYEDVNVVVDAPKGHIENHAKFGKIEIQNISGSTWKEFSVGNIINYSAPSGRVEVAENANIGELNVAGSDAAGLDLVNDGVVTTFNIRVRSVITITGESTFRMETVINAATEITTRIPLDVQDNSNNVSLDLRSGAETTRVEVATSVSIPDITGQGRIEVTQGTTVTYVVADNSGAGESSVDVTGRVVTGSGEDIEGADVYIIPYTGKMSDADVAAAKGTAAASAKTNASGIYTGKVALGNYYVLAEKAGYVNAVTTLIATSDSGSAVNVADIALISTEDAAKTGNICGVIRDAETGNGAEAGLTLELRSGANNISGPALKTTNTTDGGTYAFEDLSLGTYTILVADNRTDSDKHYISTSFDVNVAAEGDNVAPDKAISYFLDSEQVRFVLTWGDEASGAPSDLDSHLIGPAKDGEGQFHTWYSDKEYCYQSETGSLRAADLDRDDTTWSGPETTTIYSPSEGMYHFYIHDYTNGSSLSSDALSRSKAVVKVFRGTREMDSFSVPSGEGTLWYVCDYDAVRNKVYPKNTMSYYETEYLSEMGMDLVETYNNRLNDNISEAEGYLAGMNSCDLKTEGSGYVSEAKRLVGSEDVNALRSQCSRLRDWCERVEDSLRVSVYDDEYSYDWYYESEDGLNVIYITGYTADMPELTIIAADESSTAVVGNSDKSGYLKAVTVTAASGLSKKYYIKYQRSTSGLRIDEVTALNGEDSLITDWWTDYSYDEDDNEFEILVLGGTKASTPAGLYDKLTIKTAAEDTNIVYAASDRSGYDKKVTISYKDDSTQSRTYYIRYSVDEDYLLRISDLSAYEGEKNLIWDWYTDYDWYYFEDTEREQYVLVVSGITSTLPAADKFRIECRSSEASWRIAASDLEEYAGKIIVTAGDLSRDYYIKYRPYNGALYIDYVNAYDDEENNLISSWDTETLNDDDGEETNILHINGYTDTASADLYRRLTITPSEDATARVTASDIAGYDKMVVLTYNVTGGVSRNYYIDYSVDIEWLLRPAGISSTDGSVVDWSLDDWLYDDYDNRYYIYYVLGTGASFDDIRDNVVVQTNSPDVAVSVEASDDAYYDGMIVTSAEGQSRKTYIRYEQANNEYYGYDTDEEGFMNVDVAYSLLNEFRTDPDNLWYWNEDDTDTISVPDLEEVSYDAELEEVAKVRAKEAWEQYYANGLATHDRPDGSECFTAYPSALTAKGENLAWGQSDAWMAVTDPENGWAETNFGYSGQGHRRNMLSDKFNVVGIACYVQNGQTAWAMCLGRR